MRTIIGLSIHKTEDKVTARYRNGAHQVVKSLANITEFDAFVEERAQEWGVPVEEISLMLSSTIDFPADYTDNKETLALCRYIRSGSKGKANHEPNPPTVPGNSGDAPGSPPVLPNPQGNDARVGVGPQKGRSQPTG